MPDPIEGSDRAVRDALTEFKTLAKYLCVGLMLSVLANRAYRAPFAAQVIDLVAPAS